MLISDDGNTAGIRNIVFFNYNWNAGKRQIYVTAESFLVLSPSIHLSLFSTKQIMQKAKASVYRRYLDTKDVVTVIICTWTTKTSQVQSGRKQTLKR
jgi:hypothetical protein